jgi:cytochrome P450
MSERRANPYHKSPDRTPPAPRACPVDPEFSPFGAGYLRNPYPELEKLNAETPVFYSARLQSVVVTRMDQILEVFMHPDVFSSANVQDPVFPLCDRARSILATDDFNPVAVMSNRQPPRPRPHPEIHTRGLQRQTHGYRRALYPEAEP